jgi:hypothetical protein
MQALDGPIVNIANPCNHLNTFALAAFMGQRQQDRRRLKHNIWR